MEEDCLILPPQAATELRSAIYSNVTTPSKLNITQEEARALKELGKDQSRVILTVDKGVALVVLDKQDYINKVQDIPMQRYTYRPINVDPLTNKNQTYQLSTYSGPLWCTLD